MSSTIYALSSDCPNMIELASGLGMQRVSPNTWTALQNDCCTASSGVYCDGNQRVYEISWNSMGLNGVINGAVIPSSVTILYLHNNAITGSIPDVLPNGLVWLYLYDNAITGNIPNSLPGGLTRLYVYGNQMSGDLTSFPSTLTRLGLGYPGSPGNHFSGSLRLNRPVYLWINDNWITNVIIQDSSLIIPGSCDLSNNPLLGNSDINKLTMCTQNGLYNQSLLPITQSTLSKLAKTTTRSTTLVTALIDVTNTEFGYTTVQQMASSGMSANGTQPFILTSTAVTVAFLQKMSGFDVNLGMMMRVLISGMFLTYVMTRTPFKREFKRTRNKGKTASSSPEF